MLSRFDLYYQRVILFGLVAVVWFGALAKAAYDLWAAVFLFFLTSILTLLFCVGRSRDGKPIKAPLIIPCIFLLATMALSLMHSYDIDSALLNIWGWFYSFILFYLFVNVVETERDRQLFYTAASWVLVPLALICIWQQATGHPDGYGYWEIHATFLNSIVLAGFLLYWIPYLLTQSLKESAYKPLLLCALIGLVLSRSWWAYVCLALTGVHFYRQSLNEAIGRHKPLALLTGCLCFMSLIFIVFLKLRVHKGPYLGVSRLYYWKSGWAMWRNHPWTGVGLGGFAAAYPYFKIGPVQNTLFVHSFPVQILSETGLLGLCSVFVFSTATLKMFAISDRCSRSVFLSTLIGILCFSLISVHMEYLINRVMILMLIGAILTDAPQTLYRIKPLWMITILSGVILISPQWLRLLQASRLYVAGNRYETQGDLSKAESCYLNAISLDRHQADSYEALARIHHQHYITSHVAQEAFITERYLQQALSARKDLRNEKRLTDMASIR